MRLWQGQFTQPKRGRNRQSAARGVAGHDDAAGIGPLRNESTERRDRVVQRGRKRVLGCEAIVGREHPCAAQLREMPGDRPVRRRRARAIAAAVQVEDRAPRIGVAGGPRPFARHAAADGRLEPATPRRQREAGNPLQPAALLLYGQPGKKGPAERQLEHRAQYAGHCALVRRLARRPHPRFRLPHSAFANPQHIWVAFFRADRPPSMRRQARSWK